MKLHKEKKELSKLRLPVTLSVIALLLIGIVAAFSDNAFHSGNEEIAAIVKKDSARSVHAFKKVYAVLQSPRCMNCHPSGDIPLQGDDSRLHAMFPKRGADGK